MAVDDDDIRVVFLSHMFPNSISLNAVPFMIERAMAISRLVTLKTIAPVSSFPFFRNRLAPISERLDGLHVYHPRYVALPSFLWSMRWYPYLLAFKSFWKRKNIECDILHVEWIYPDAYAAVCYAREKGVKTVGVVHGNEAIEYFGPPGHKKKYIEAFGRLDHIIVVSNDLNIKLANEYSVDPQKISIVLNGVDVSKFSLLDKRQARRELGLPSNRPVGVCVARLSEEKNLHILAEAVFQLKEAVPLIYVIGDGPLKKKLEALIDRLETGNKVNLVGAVPHDKVALWLNAADYFYLPSQREGCPVVVHEALACGVPVIATSVGAIPDLIKDNRYGLLCEPDDVSAFADIMKRAMSMKWDRNAISAYGRQFTWDKMARETVKIYTSILR